MSRMLALVTVVVLLVVGGPVGLAQVETPVADPGAASLASPSASPAAGPVVDLTGVAPLPLTGERRAAFEAYAADVLSRFGVPGASVAVVQDGQVVYLQGFGVTEVGGTRPVTADTLMMIGSVTKSMTSAMAATLVDDGRLSWDTPVVELLPDFAVADPALTPRLTVADAFCACTGMPQRDLDLAFNFDALTPERLIAQVAELPLTAPLGEMYQYSNQMYAVGGYAVAAAAGAAPDDLFGGYAAAMRERILGPIGMDRSTFVPAEVLADGDYALPHANDLAGRTAPFPLQVDGRFVGSVAPAGALWSSAREMARYLQTQLADGVAPDGTRVVSTENLARTRASRVAIPSEGQPPIFAESAQGYGLGWNVGAYKGQPLVNHSGQTFGFGSEVAFLPEAGLGIMILTNEASSGVPFALAVQYRLLELLFGQALEFDAMMGQFIEMGAAQAAQRQAQLGPVDPAAVAPYLGRYANPMLGEVELALRDGELVFDAGEFRSELQTLTGEAGQAAYVFVDPPLANPAPVTLRQDAGGRPEVAVGIAGQGADVYVFTLIGPDAAATPPA